MFLHHALYTVLTNCKSILINICKNISFTIISSFFRIINKALNNMRCNVKHKLKLLHHFQVI